MKNSKLLHFLKTLSTHEFLRFEKYVKSPYFNVHTETVALFDMMKDHYPEFESASLEAEIIFGKLYPGDVFDPAKIYTLKKYLLNLLMDFLSLEELESDSFLGKQLALQRVLYKRKLEQYIPKILEKSTVALGDYPFRDANFLHELFRLEELRSEYSMSQNNRSSSFTYETAMESLDHFYLLQKLKYLCVILNQQQVSSSSRDIQMLDEILGFCEGRDLSHIPGVQMYYLALMMFYSEDGEKYFSQLRDTLPRHADIFQKEDQTNLYTYLINYCNLLYKRGNMDYMRQMFVLFKQMLARDLLFTSSLAASIYYKNLVTVGLKVKEYEWTEKFIREHRDKIDAKYRKGVYSYNMANLYFTTKEYSRSLKFLQQVSFIDPYFRMNYDLLLLKTYYECDEVEGLYSLCTSFSAYIRRKSSLSENNKKAYMNMAKFLRRMAKIKYGTKRRLPHLKQAIAECKLLVERNWIQEKLDEFETKKARI